MREKLGSSISLTVISEADALRLKEKYPTLPNQYLAFLTEIGHGNLGRVQIYPAPVDPVQIYSEARRAVLKDIVIIGDDMQGFCYGFDLKDPSRIVEIDPRGSIDRTIDPTFESLIRFVLE